MLKTWSRYGEQWGEFRDPEADRYCYNLPGPLKYILPLAAAAAPFLAPALGGALGIGEAAAGGAGAADVVTDTGLAAALNAAPDLAGGVTATSLGATPLAATAPALAGATSELVSGLPNAVTGLPAGSGAFGASAAAPLAGTSVTSAPILGPASTSPIADTVTGLPAATTPTAPGLSTGGAGGALPGPGASAAGTAAPASVAPASSDPAFFMGAFSDAGPASGGAAGGDLATALANPNLPITAGTVSETPLTAAQLSGVPGGTTNLADLGAAYGAGGVSGPSGATAGGSNLLSTLKSDVLPFVGPATALLGLGYEGTMANRQLPGEPQISNAANTISSNAAGLTTQGQQLASYLQSGTLPPGVQNSLNTAGNQAKEAVKSIYASRGMSGSSDEAEDLAAVDQTVATQGTQIATQLLNTGISEQQGGISATGLSAELYQTIMNTALARDSALGSAIGNFASSLVPRNLTINAT